MSTRSIRFLESEFNQPQKTVLNVELPTTEVTRKISAKRKTRTSAKSKVETISIDVSEKIRTEAPMLFEALLRKPAEKLSVSETANWDYVDGYQENPEPNPEPESKLDPDKPCRMCGAFPNSAKWCKDCRQ